MTRRTARRPPRTYVVRVYRIMRQAVAGQVEDVDGGSIRSFSSADELWALIGGRRKPSVLNRRTSNEANTSVRSGMQSTSRED